MKIAKICCTTTTMVIMQLLVVNQLVDTTTKTIEGARLHCVAIDFDHCMRTSIRRRISSMPSDPSIDFHYFLVATDRHLIFVQRFEAQSEVQMKKLHPMK